MGAVHPFAVDQEETLITPDTRPANRERGWVAGSTPYCIFNLEEAAFCLLKTCQQFLRLYVVLLSVRFHQRAWSHQRLEAVSKDKPPFVHSYLVDSTPCEGNSTTQVVGGRQCYGLSGCKGLENRPCAEQSVLERG